jgi:hypothetical protein
VRRRLDVTSVACCTVRRALSVANIPHCIEDAKAIVRAADPKCKERLQHVIVVFYLLQP